MASRVPLLLICAVLCVVSCPSPVAAQSPLSDLFGGARKRFESNVDVVYAVVPRTELAKAVVSRQAALEVEQTFFARAEQERRGTLTIINDFSIVVFLKNNDLAHISGRLGVALPGQPGKFFEVSIPAISQRTDSVYVVDGGAMSFGFHSREKSVKWIKITGR